MNACDEDPSLRKSDFVKLQAVMDVIRDAHAGRCRVIQRFTGQLQYPTLTGNFFDELLKALEWVDEVKRSSCRKGVIQALTLGREYYPGIDLEKLAQGFPELKADGSRYQKADYAQVARIVCQYATKIANDMNL